MLVNIQNVVYKSEFLLYPFTMRPKFLNYIKLCLHCIRHAFIDHKPERIKAINVEGIKKCDTIYCFCGKWGGEAVKFLDALSPSEVYENYQEVRGGWLRPWGEIK